MITLRELLLAHGIKPDDVLDTKIGRNGVHKWGEQQIFIRGAIESAGPGDDLGQLEIEITARAKS